ncbi:hypothetical protein H4S08_004874, partial [Coemansia sp. RSA 1365]
MANSASSSAPQDSHVPAAPRVPAAPSSSSTLVPAAHAGPTAIATTAAAAATTPVATATASTAPRRPLYSDVVVCRPGRASAAASQPRRLHPAAVAELEEYLALRNLEVFIYFHVTTLNVVQAISAHLLKALSRSPKVALDDAKHSMTTFLYNANRIGVVLKDLDNLRKLTFAPFIHEEQTFLWTTELGTLVPVGIVGAPATATPRRLTAAMRPFGGLSHLEPFLLPCGATIGDWKGFLHLQPGGEIPETIEVTRDKIKVKILSGSILARCPSCKFMDPAMCSCAAPDCHPAVRKSRATAHNSQNPATESSEVMDSENAVPTATPLMATTVAPQATVQQPPLVAPPPTAAAMRKTTNRPTTGMSAKQSGKQPDNGNVVATNSPNSPSPGRKTSRATIPLPVRSPPTQQSLHMVTETEISTNCTRSSPPAATQPISPGSEIFSDTITLTPSKSISNPLFATATAYPPPQSNLNGYMDEQSVISPSEKSMYFECSPHVPVRERAAARARSISPVATPERRSTRTRRSNSIVHDNRPVTRSRAVSYARQHLSGQELAQNMATAARVSGQTSSSGTLHARLNAMKEAYQRNSSNSHHKNGVNSSPDTSLYDGSFQGSDAQLYKEGRDADPSNMLRTPMQSVPISLNGNTTRALATPISTDIQPQLPSSRPLPPTLSRCQRASTSVPTIPLTRSAPPLNIISQNLRGIGCGSTAYTSANGAHAQPIGHNWGNNPLNHDTVVLIHCRVSKAQFESAPSCTRATFVTILSMGLLFVFINGTFNAMQTWNNDIITTILLYKNKGWTPIIGGDFNIAPQLEDHPNTDCQAEPDEIKIVAYYKQALDVRNVCQHLYPTPSGAHMSSDWAPDHSAFFTFKHTNDPAHLHGIWTSRIDLFILPITLLMQSSILYDAHNTGGFSDHKELWLHLPMSEINRLRKAHVHSANSEQGAGWIFHHEWLVELEEQADALVEIAAINIQQREANVWLHQGDCNQFWMSMKTKKFVHPHTHTVIAALCRHMLGNYSTDDSLAFTDASLKETVHTYYKTMYSNTDPDPAALEVLLRRLRSYMAEQNSRPASRLQLTIPLTFLLEDIEGRCKRTGQHKDLGPNGIPVELYMASPMAQCILVHLGTIWLNIPTQVPS